MYTVYIGDGTFGHHSIVNFDKSGVHITPIHEPVVEGDGPLEIEKIAEKQLNLDPIKSPCLTSLRYSCDASTVLACL